MNFKKFMRKYGPRLGAMIFAVVFIVSVSAHFLNGKAGFVSDTAGVIKAPVQNAVSTVVEWFESLYGYIYDYDKLVAENESLRAQLADAQEEARLGSEAREENENLRELLNLSQKHSDFVFESARIVNWNSSNWSSSFTISKGESSGLEVGQPVVTEAGELVGQISELGETWANVKTIIDVDTHVGVLVGESGNAAMAIGDFALMQKGFAKITYLTEGSVLLEGDIVMTSGQGGAFPQGLVVGYIDSVLTEAGGQMPYGVLRPSCDLGSLSQIFIIKEFNVVE
ncbi:MAG: rod shape-determining protein MreC [Oscillospiraceae bacterium]